MLYISIFTYIYIKHQASIRVNIPFPWILWASSTVKRETYSTKQINPHLAERRKNQGFHCVALNAFIVPSGRGAEQINQTMRVTTGREGSQATRMDRKSPTNHGSMAPCRYPTDTPFSDGFLGSKLGEMHLKYCLFHFLPLPKEMIHFDVRILFKWVETTN